jgi:3-hydroxyanthranilate 3,4-dioxygenase
MVLRVVDDGAFRDILIKEGAMFLLPSWVPHSPQRFPDTVGLVIERKRAAGEEDKLRWYCDDCVSVLHEETFPLEDIATQLKAVIERFNASESLRTCKACGALKSTTPRR